MSTTSGTDRKTRIRIATTERETSAPSDYKGPRIADGVSRTSKGNAMQYFIRFDEDDLVRLVKAANNALTSREEFDMRHALEDITEILISELESIGGPALEALRDHDDEAKESDNQDAEFG